jgi:EmrB/QacA subfamily drug resistance transporter
MSSTSPAPVPVPVPVPAAEPAPSGPTPIDARVWLMAVVVVLGGFMTILDTTIVNVALVSIEQRLHATLANAQWIVTGYLLAVGATLPVTGWATRRLGARRIFLVSLALFTLGSVLCGIATTLPELIGFRVLQGVGGALIVPVGQAALTKAAGVNNVARLTSVVGGPMLFAPVIGPTIGGALVDGPGWRWIFFVNLPIGAIALVAGLRYFTSADSGREHAGRLDLRGLILLSAGLVGLMYGISEIGVLDKVAEPHVLVPFILGVLLCAAFVAHAARTERPILDIGLYRDRAYSMASILMATGGAALFGSQIIMPLFFQELRGQTAFHTGLLLIPQGVGVVTGITFAGGLTTRLGGGISTIAGTALTIVSTIPFAFAGAHTSYGLLAPFLVVRGLGLGLSILPAMTAAVIGLRPDQIDDATPQLNALQRVGGSVGAALLTVVLSRQVERLHPVTLGGAAHAFDVTWVWALAITAIGSVPALWLTRIERAARRRVDRGVPGEDERGADAAPALGLHERGAVLPRTRP